MEVSGGSRLSPPPEVPPPPAFVGTCTSYELLSRVGEGTFGVVRQAVDKESRREVAIKQICKVFDDHRMTRRVLRELRVLHRFRHKNIIDLLDVTLARGAVYVITDLSRTDLYQLIHHNKQAYKSLDEENFTDIMRQILDAIEFLHSNGILHRDIKPSNILLNEKMTIHLCDFGLCRKLAPSPSPSPSLSLSPSRTSPHSESQPKMQHRYSEMDLEEEEATPGPGPPMTPWVVTRWYRAPEVCLSEGFYDTSQDVWSAGCTMIELVTQSTLFPGNSTWRQVEMIVGMLGLPEEADLPFPIVPRYRPWLQTIKSSDGRQLQDIVVPTRCMRGANRESFIDLIHGMLQFNPSLRLTASACLARRFFRAEGKALDSKQGPFVEVHCSFEDIERDDPTSRTNLSALLVREVQHIQRDIRDAFLGVHKGSPKIEVHEEILSESPAAVAASDPPSTNSSISIGTSASVPTGRRMHRVLSEDSIFSQVSSKCKAILKSSASIKDMAPDKMPSERPGASEKDSCSATASLGSSLTLSSSTTSLNSSLSSADFANSPEREKHKKAGRERRGSLRESLSKMLGFTSDEAKAEAKG